MLTSRRLRLDVEAALVDEVERLDRVARRLRGDGRREHDRGARARELGRDVRQALQVLRALSGGRGEGRVELRADGVAEQERDAAAALLVESDLERLCDRLLAGTVEASEEDDEALLRTGRVALAEGLDDSPSYTLAKWTDGKYRGPTRKRTSQGWERRS